MPMWWSTLSDHDFRLPLPLSLWVRYDSFKLPLQHGWFRRIYCLRKKARSSAVHSTLRRLFVNWRIRSLQSFLSVTSPSLLIFYLGSFWKDSFVVNALSNYAVYCFDRDPQDMAPLSLHRTWYKFFHRVASILVMKRIQQIPVVPSFGYHFTAWKQNSTQIYQTKYVAREFGNTSASVVLKEVKLVRAHLGRQSAAKCLS